MPQSRFSAKRLDAILVKLEKSIDSSSKRDSSPYGKAAHSRNQKRHLSGALYARKRRSS